MPSSRKDHLPSEPLGNREVKAHATCLIEAQRATKSLRCSTRCSGTALSSLETHREGMFPVMNLASSFTRIVIQDEGHPPMASPTVGCRSPGVGRRFNPRGSRT